jgi:hypothetical protein
MRRFVLFSPFLATCFTLLAVALPAFAAAAPPLPDLRPWITLQAFGSTIAAVPIETDVFIFRGGSTFAMASHGEQPTAVRRGVAVRSQIASLRAALRDSHIAQQQGGCGEPMPDFIARFDLAWHGQAGLHQITFGGDLSGCPKDLQNAYQAICHYVFATAGYALPSCPLPAAAPTWAAERADP